MTNIEILEHSSSRYAPRTYANAANADVTIALAVDYSTAGERLTHRAAGDKYLALPLSNPWKDNARLLYKHMKLHNCSIVNVAGNGIYTLDKHQWTQTEINNYVYYIFDTVSDHLPIDRIISGGQTGVDIAGGWAAVKLGIDCTLTLPKGYLQRHEDGKDVTHTREEIMEQITSK